MFKIIISLIVLVLLYSLIVPGYSDYSPRLSQVKVRGAMQPAYEIQEILTPLCATDLKALNMTELRKKLPEADSSKIVLSQEIKLISSGHIRYKLSVNDMFSSPTPWYIPGETSKVVVPAGSNVVLDGSCISAEKFKWHIISSTIPQSFLPKL